MSKTGHAEMWSRGNPMHAVNPMHRQRHGAVCGARTRAGGTCDNPPMRGRRRCRMHGGATPRGADSVHFVHGKYSRHLPARLLERLEAAASDERAIDLREELALTSARLSDVLSRVDSGACGELWRLALAAATDVQAAAPHNGVLSDPAAREEAIERLCLICADGHADSAAWAEVLAQVEQKRKLVHTQTRLDAVAGKMVPISEVVTFHLAVTAVLRDALPLDLRRGVLAALERLLPLSVASPSLASETSARALDRALERRGQR